MRKRDDIVDEDGNLIPPPDPNSPIGQIVWLMEYGRKRGFRIGPRVQVGDTIAEVLDLRQQLQVSKAQRGDAPDLAPGSDMAVLLGDGEG